MWIDLDLVMTYPTHSFLDSPLFLLTDLRFRERGGSVRWPQSTLSLLCTICAEKRTNGAEKRKCTLGPP